MPIATMFRGPILNSRAATSLLAAVLWKKKESSTYRLFIHEDMFCLCVCWPGWPSNNHVFLCSNSGGRGPFAPNWMLIFRLCHLVSQESRCVQRAD